MSDEKQEQSFLYFNRTVLCHYRASPDLYALHEDDMGGVLKAVSSPEQSMAWFQVRFGFRRLEDGRVCVAGFSPDIAKLARQELLIWRGHLIESPVFAKEDPAFDRWTKRYLMGSWEVEDGPKPKIERLLKLIRAVTRSTLGNPLFRFEDNSLLNYPIAENTEAYTKAHLELYRLLLDGLDGAVISALATRLGQPLSDPSWTFNSLKEVLPSGLISQVHEPLKKCYHERQKNHGVPTQRPESFAAFDSFHKDLVGIEAGLSGLNDWLQSVLSVDSDACLRREEAMKMFPKIDRPPRPEHKLGELQKSVGKTIQSIEFGEEARHPDLHQSEGIVLHFTDNTSMAIIVGSNAMNLGLNFKGLKPPDVHTDLMIRWAPSISVR